jgi:hypothetical protein
VVILLSVRVVEIETVMGELVPEDEEASSGITGGVGVGSSSSKVVTERVWSATL